MEEESVLVKLSEKKLENIVKDIAPTMEKYKDKEDFQVTLSILFFEGYYDSLGSYKYPHYKLYCEYSYKVKATILGREWVNTKTGDITPNEVKKMLCLYFAEDNYKLDDSYVSDEKDENGNYVICNWVSKAKDNKNSVTNSSAKPVNNKNKGAEEEEDIWIDLTETELEELVKEVAPTMEKYKDKEDLQIKISVIFHEGYYLSDGRYRDPRYELKGDYSYKVKAIVHGKEYESINTGDIPAYEIEEMLNKLLKKDGYEILWAHVDDKDENGDYLISITVGKIKEKKPIETEKVKEKDCRNIEMKSVFLAKNDYDDAATMVRYLQDDLGIAEAKTDTCIAGRLVDVPKEQYEEALIKGKEYAVNNNLGLAWVNWYNEPTPLDSVELAYGILPKKRLLFERPDYNRLEWNYDEKKIPAVVRGYLEILKRYIRSNNVFVKYNQHDNALTIASSGLDYDTKHGLLEEFIQQFGYGPFLDIHSLDITGEYVEESIPKRRVK